jgi:tetratricopeptide (TPR) repeat protein
MGNQRNTGFCNHTIWALGILLVLTFSAYSNTFQASWHLDDYPTVVHNSRLHLENFELNSIAATFYSRPAVIGNTYRPVSCLSLALNWFFGGKRVAGYHLVNISIHFLTAFFLYLTVYSLLKTPRLAGRHKHRAFYVALLSAALWALNPVQTQAVTYIVQRMASLAAMFYILGLYFYVKGRSGNVRWQQFLCFTAVIIWYAMAVWSKENAIILPLALLLTEIVFFQNLDSRIIVFKIRMLAASIGILLLSGFIYVVYYSNDVAILNGYQYRAFTLGQRLMTEPRIIIFYLSQLFYPMPQRLSIEHAVQLSTSFMQPWTTIPAVVLVIILVGIGIFQIKKRPIVAFALLFYFLNHLIESTVLPLELIFEHRNYLPSLFLFWPVAAWLFLLVDYYQPKSGLMAKALVAFLVLLVVGLGFSTFIRNSIWATEITLWEDTVKKAPGRARATYNLAKQYAGAGRLDDALALFQTALAQEASRPQYTQALILNGIASIYYKKGDLANSLKYSQKALEVNPAFHAARYNVVLVLAKLNQWEKVNDQIDLQLGRRKNNKEYQYLKGELLLKQNQAAESLVYFRNALKLDPNDRMIWLNIGKAFILMNQYRQAEWFLQRFKTKSPTDIRAYIYLIEIGLNSKNTEKTDHFLEDLFSRFTLQKLNYEQQHCFEAMGLRPAVRKLICTAVNDKMIRMADKMARMGRL